MKNIVYLIAVAMAFCSLSLSGQNDTKKKGKVWSQIKKGVESTTGLDVSKETLFVYPELGLWKMALVSAEGNTETGVVTIKINVMPLNKQESAFIELNEVTGGDNQIIPEGKNWKETSKFMTRDLSESPLFHDDLAAGKYSEYTLQPIVLPTDMKSIKTLKFTVEAMHKKMKGFEARDIPVTWKTPEKE